MSIRRREFLKYVGWGTAGIVTSEWLINNLVLNSTLRPFQAKLPKGLGIENWVTSVCQQCPGGCGIKVRLIDGQPVKIDGNPLYPVNRGKLCPAGHSGLQVLYNPDRIKSPLKRVGSGSERNWERISWNEALNLVQNKLTELRGENSPHKLVFLDGDSRGLMETVIKRFMTSYGSPNHIYTNFKNNIRYAYSLMQGGDGRVAYDLSNSNFVLSFGSDFLEAEDSPVWFARMYGQLRQGENRTRAKIVQVDTRFSITAAKSDKWISINPGTEGALALGIAYVILQEELYDQEFIKEYTFRFDDWMDSKGIKHTGFKNLVLRDYYPETVSRITGVSIEDIIRVARAFAQNTPSVAICGKGAYSYSNGFYNQIAIHSLNALVGNIGKPGGLIFPFDPPFTPLPEVFQDNTAKKGLYQPKVSQDISNYERYPVEILFLYHTNPVFEISNTQKVIETFQKIPFIVSFSSFFDESSVYADLILPEHTFLEKWQDDTCVPGIGFPHAGIRKPIVEPLYDTRHPGDVLIQLAHRMGGPMNRSFDFPDFLSLMKYSFRGIYESGRGTIVSEEFAEAMMVYLEKRGWRVPGAKNYDEFWEQLTEKGGWVDAVEFPPTKDIFQTSSRKFEFYLQTLQNPSSKKTDEIFFPHFEEPEFVGDKNKYPLYLKVFDTNTLFGGTGASQPMLSEMVGFRFYRRWDSWVEINPETADEYGIKDNDFIWIESPIGKCKARVKIFSGAMPDVIQMPLGMGHTAYGRYAKNRGANPNEITADKFDTVSGTPIKFSTRVKIYQA